jgi:hypothetical protein
MPYRIAGIDVHKKVVAVAVAEVEGDFTSNAARPLRPGLHVCE